MSRRLFIYVFSLILMCKLNNSNAHILQQLRADFDPCYERSSGKSIKCSPKFENIAFDKIVKASSTCGSPGFNYCVERFKWKDIEDNNGIVSHLHCSKCDSLFPNSIRAAKYLTDLEELNRTCWVSSLINNPSNFNISLTISFRKKYELTYISLDFCNYMKPDSFVVLKSMDHGKNWIPLQYYSSDCKKVYKKNLKTKVTYANEQEAICTDSHLSNILKLKNRIGFSTLEGRPSFNEFDTSPVLQDWVTATDIRIIFNRLVSTKAATNQIVGSVLNGSKTGLDATERPYYLSLSDLSIGGRCKCNGHASSCTKNKYVHISKYRV